MSLQGSLFKVAGLLSLFMASATFAEGQIYQIARFATAALGARIFHGYSDAINLEALQILDGADPTKIPKYADEIYPAVAPIEDKAQQHESALEIQQQRWLKSKGLQ